MARLRTRKSPKIEVDGISLDVLYRRPPIIYDPISEKDRSKFTYFRGFHLGKIACNILQDRPLLNTGEDNLISFGSYYRARWAAQNVIESSAGDPFQFTHNDRKFIKSKTGLVLPARMSAMIVALTPGVELGASVDIERYDRETPLRELESVSRAELQRLLDLPDDLVS